MFSKYRDKSTAQEFIAEWSTGAKTQNGDERFRVINPRGTKTMMFGIWNSDDKGPGSGWDDMPIVRPERFGLRRAPSTYAEFLKFVKDHDWK